MNLPARKPVQPKSNRILLNRTFDTEAEMINFVKQNYKEATIKLFYPKQVLICEIEIPENKS